MKTFVSAEFDSVDMADLASGRVRSTRGVIGLEVLQNKLSNNNEHDHWILPPIMSSSSSSSIPGVVPVVPLYTTSFDSGARSDFEPARRRDALLRVQVTDDKSAQQVSSVLRNIGGLCITIMHR